MLIVFRQLFILYIFLILGCFFGKRKPALLGQTGILSFLLVNLFLPSKVFSTFSTNFTVSYLQDNYTTILISVSLLLLLHFLSIPLAKLLEKDGYERKVYEYSLTITNYAYMGYALAEGVFGVKGLTDLILFCIPFSIYTYTVGYVKLTGDGNYLKRLVNPMTVAISLGIFFGLTGIEVPMIAARVLSSSAACVGALSMLLTGLTLASFPLRSLFLGKKCYALVVLRLLALPLLVFAICKILPLEQVLPSALFVAAMPTGLNTIVFPKSVGKSPELGARLAFLSHLFSCITVPLWLSMLL